MPVPFGEEPFLIGREMDWVAPGLSPRSLWVQKRGAALSEAAVAVSEYDGVAREIVRTVELPPEQLLVSELAGGFVVSGKGGGVSLWNGARLEPLVEDTRHLIARNNGVSAWFRANQTNEQTVLVLIDVQEGREVDVHVPEGGRWQLWGSFAPDGSRLAIDVDYSPQLTEEVAFAALRDAITGRGAPHQERHRLALIIGLR